MVLQDLLKVKETIDESLKPASLKNILHALEAVASTFKTALPEEMGLKVYLSILKDIPHLAMQRACLKVCSTHKYPNFPTPISFIEASQSTNEMLLIFKKRTDLAINNLNLVWKE
ncbi:hypothetical protein EBR37_02680 [bacterium]|nr:hypothetical protein [bacterium]